MAEGYYEVRNANLSLRDGQLKLCLDLSQYHPFKSGWAHIGKYNNGDIFPFQVLKGKHLGMFGSYTPGEPLFATAEEVLGYREGLA